LHEARCVELAYKVFSRRAPRLVRSAQIKSFFCGRVVAFLVYVIGESISTCQQLRFSPISSTIAAIKHHVLNIAIRFKRNMNNTMTGIISILWTPEWLEALGALVKTIVEVAEAFRTIFYWLGKLLAA
jgi:hypothetical protein